MITKHLFAPVAILLVSSALLTACKDEENPTIGSSTTRLTATINAQQEKPMSTTSPATGTFAGDLNTTTRVLSYTVTYQGFPADDAPNGGHLHKITQANGTGPIDVPFKSLTSPIMETTGVLPQSKVDSMLAGFYYVNIHTPKLPAGAIRGDIRRR